MTVEELIETYQKRDDSYKQMIFLQEKIINNLNVMNNTIEEKCKILEKENEKLRRQVENLERQIVKKTSKKCGKRE